MKVNDPTNKKNTHKDFSDHFHNIENFVQVEHLKENFEKPLHFFVFPLHENRRKSEKFPKWQKLIHIRVRLSDKNFSKIGPPRASQFELKPDCQSY
jgi:hypothetical protein